MSRVLITGIDGVTFDILDPWMDEGVMPYLASIRREGITAPLRSTFPPITAPAWVSFMTGKNPGKTGIFEFLYSKGGTFEQTPVNATVRDGIPLWEILSREKRRVVVLGVPVTYPPDPVRGTLISGFLTPPGARDFTRPPELLEELESAFGPYPIYHKEVYQKGKVDRVLDEAFRVLDYRRKVSLELIAGREWDFAITYFEGTDRVQHELWHVFDESHPHSNPKEVRAHKSRVLDFYRAVDETAREIGDACRALDPDLTEIVMSDHGFGPIHTYMNFNVWLWENGFLHLRRDPATRLKTVLFRMGLTPALGYRAAMRLGLAGLRLSRGVGARSVFFDWINRLFLSLENIDWERTRAFSKGNYGQIYVNLRGREKNGSVDPADYDRTADELAGKLREIRDPEDGGPLLGEVFRREERYEGPYVERMPDVLFIPRDMKHKALGIVDFTTRRFLEPTFGNSGDHRMDGVFFARGGPIREGAGRADRLSIADVAPTVLHLFGLPVPEDMDGRVIETGLRPEWLRENPVRFRPPYERARPEELDLTDAERREMIDRLKGMGYVG